MKRRSGQHEAEALAQRRAIYGDPDIYTVYYDDYMGGEDPQWTDADPS